MQDLFQNTQFLMTSAILVAAFAVAGLLIWQEKRPRKHLMPNMLPTTPVLLLCAIVIMLTAVHLIHIVAPGAISKQQ